MIRDRSVDASASPACPEGRLAETQRATHYLYVLECADGSLYTGYTVDIEHRIAAHNEGRGAKYTRSRGPVKLAALAEFETKHAAMRAEYRFKKLSRAEKIALVDEGSRRPFLRVLEERFGIDEGDSRG